MAPHVSLPRLEPRSFAGSLNGHASYLSCGSSHYQNLTIKLIATEMLHHGPHYRSAISEISEATDNAQDQLSLVLPGEIDVAKLVRSHVAPRSATIVPRSPRLSHGLGLEAKASLAAPEEPEQPQRAQPREPCSALSLTTAPPLSVCSGRRAYTTEAPRRLVQRRQPGRVALGPRARGGDGWRRRSG